MKVVFREAQPLDFDKVAELVTDADELYVISPKSHFPWTAEQVANIAQTREFNTVAIDDDSQIIIGYANMYNVTERPPILAMSSCMMSTVISKLASS